MNKDHSPNHQLNRQDLQSILNSLNEGIITLNDEGTVIDINQPACEILQIDKGKAVQEGCVCLLGNDLCDPGSELRLAIRERRPLHHQEVEITTPNGDRKVITLKAAVLRDQDGQARGGVVVFQDITEMASLRKNLRERYQLHNIVGKSKAMQNVFQLLEEVADAEANVLIEGESGTGKELIARACHRLSSRATGPFVAVNCSALSENLLESELFGHVRGSFTGATHDKKGRFELAHGGTIFLDEIGELSTKVQVKLLRVLQERSIERVGDDKQIPVDIRVITATHQSLNELVSHGRFRHDLYYRLRVVPFSLPPLRERRDDIPLLAQHFVEKFRERTGRSIQGVDESALSLMLDYNWPGNVREMENAIEYAFIKARRGLIRPVHLPPELLNCPLVKSVSHVPTVSRQTRRSDITRDKLEQALTRSGWNIAKTARQLGTTRNTIYKRIEEFGLATPNI